MIVCKKSNLTNIAFRAKSEVCNDLIICERNRHVYVLKGWTTDEWKSKPEVHGEQVQRAKAMQALLDMIKLADFVNFSAKNKIPADLFLASWRVFFSPGPRHGLAGLRQQSK